MRRIAIGLTAATVVLFASGMSAQGTPNFAGHWTMDMPAGGAAAAGGGGGGQRGGGGGGGGRGGGFGGGGGFTCGMECTITQDAKMLKVERTQGGNPVTATFMLDGTDSKNPGRGGTDVVSKVSTSGGKVTITTSQEMNMGGNAATVKTTQVLSMEGGNMVIETTRDMGQGAQPPTKQTYKKS